MAELSESDRMRIVREQVAAVETGIAEGRLPEHQRTALMRNAASVIRHEAPATPAEAALFEASRSRMASDLRGAGDIMAAATDPDLGFMPATIAVTQTPADSPREDGRYDLGDAPAPAPAAPSATTAARVELDAGGHMSYAGLPCTVGADGTPRVHVSMGAMTVETLRSMNIDLDHERLLFASRARMGNA